MSRPRYRLIRSKASGKGTKNKGKAKGKGKVNGGNKDDDDLDAIMAEIEGVGSAGTSKAKGTVRYHVSYCSVWSTFVIRQILPDYMYRVLCAFSVDKERDSSFLIR